MSPTTTGLLRPTQSPFAPTTLPASEHQAASHSINGTFGARELFSLAARFAAVCAGVAILAASTRNVIDANHLTGSDATLVAALAAGVAAASIALPRASRWMAVALVVALLAGEGFGLLSSAERIIERRETASSVITGTNDVRTSAQSRLTAALAAQGNQRDMAVEAVAMPSCARECRALLDRQATDIASEVAAARAALDKAPKSRSATPLADRLGVQPWALDLFAAALLSIGANGLAAALIAVGAAPSQPASAQPGNVAAYAVNQSEHAAAMMHSELVTAALADPTGTMLAMVPAPSARAHVGAVPLSIEPVAEQPMKAVQTALPAPSAVAVQTTAKRARTAKRKPAPRQAKTVIEGKVLDSLKSAGAAPASVRGLAALIGAPKSSVHVALASLVAAGVVERAGDCIVMASRAA